MNELIKRDPAFVNSFEGWDDGIEGADRPQGAGLIQGVLLKFGNTAEWETRDGDVIDGNLELVAVDVTRVVQKWADGRPTETRILAPGEKFPAIVLMNEAVPRGEWVTGPDGRARGPWQSQHILYLLDPASMEKYSFPTGTVGGGIAVRELIDKVNWMRRMRGPNVYPVITLADKFFPTRFGGRQRPHFNLVKWTQLGGEGDAVEALPVVAATLAPATKPELPAVSEPSLAEELNDALPAFDLAPPAEPVKPTKAKRRSR